MKKQNHPNVIWIFGDQHRGQALSCMGNTNLRTPHIDKMAETGVNFTRAVSGSPLCSPFRGSLLSGLYPHQCVPGHDCAMADGIVTLGDVLQVAGYSTAYFGKWHVDGLENRGGVSREAFQTVSKPRRRGFDTWLGYENNNSPWDCWLHGHRDDGTDVPHYLLDGYETDCLTELLLEHVDRKAQQERPFFAVLSVQPPHAPYVAPEEWMQRHSAEDVQLRPNVPPVESYREERKADLAGYYSMIENLDWNVGRVIDRLVDLDIYKNTVVIFFSDHGDMHGSQGRIYKCTPWEESIRIPFIVSGGYSELSRGQKTDCLINHIDMAPTTLGLCGVSVPENMTGFDYSCVIRGEAVEHVPDSAFLQLVDPGWGDVGYAVDRDRPWRGIVTRDGWKFAALEHQPWVMYNLNEDPYETINLVFDFRFAEKRKELQMLLEQWIARTGDEFILPEPITGTYLKHHGLREISD